MQYFKNHRKLFLKISKIKQKDAETDTDSWVCIGLIEKYIWTDRLIEIFIDWSRDKLINRNIDR